MKKVLSLLLALVMCLSLVACGGGNDAPETEATVEAVKPEITRVGQEVTIGTYYKSSGGSQEAMQWIVLDIQDGEALLISKYAIEPKSYHDVTAIYGYMNSLATEIFSEDEKALIVIQEIDGKRCYMFLLDSTEVEQYMPGENNLLRFVQATGYAESKGVSTYTNYKRSGCCNWVLRDGNWVGGQLGNAGRIVKTAKVEHRYGIRPAMWITFEG